MPTQLVLLCGDHFRDQLIKHNHVGDELMAYDVIYSLQFCAQLFSLEQSLLFLQN